MNANLRWANVALLMTSALAALPGCATANGRSGFTASVEPLNEAEFDDFALDIAEQLVTRMERDQLSLPVVIAPPSIERGQVTSGAARAFAQRLSEAVSDRLGGEVRFHASYNGNNLVNAMCVGIAPADRIFYAAAGAIGAPVAGFCAPSASNQPTWPRRATRMVTPGTVPLSISRWNASDIRCRRGRDSPSVSALASGRGGVWGVAAGCAAVWPVIKSLPIDLLICRTG